MGKVYRAREASTGRIVAVKVLTGTNEPQERSRFAREARVMTGLAHENIVEVIGHGDTGDCQYLVMEFVGGRSLAQLLRESGGQLAPDKVAQLLVGIAPALACLHERQIVHRDLKPSNILLDGDERVKLTDFGISSPVAELGDITRTNEFVGSLDYMSPEQRSRLPVDERADQFALGVIVYELLTGKRPVGTYKPPSAVQPRLHKSADAVVARALADDPDDRYASVAAFVDDMLAALARKPLRQGRSVLVACGGIAIAALTWGAVASLGESAGEEGEHEEPGAAAPVVDGSVDWADLAEQQITAGNYVAATKALDEAIRLDQRSPALFLRRALVHKLNGMFQLALDDLLAVRTLDPDLVDGWVGAGSIHVNLRNFPEAIQLLDEAIARAPEHADAHAWRGWAHHGLQEDEAAGRDLDQAIALDPDLGIAYQWRGALAKKRADWVAVGRDYAEFVRCNPDDVYAHRLLASFLALCNDRSLRNGDLAVRHATRACELTRWQSWAALRVLAYAHAEAGDLPAAIDCCDQAHELAPENRKEMLRGQKARYARRMNN